MRIVFGLHCAVLRDEILFWNMEFAMCLPNDPAILLSFINTQLRDKYESLEELCKSLCVSQSEIEIKLSSIGYAYDVNQNRFR